MAAWGVFRAFAYPGDLEYIPPREYAAVVGKELAKAKSSITVCLYLFNLRPQRHNSPVLRLAEDLRKAHQNGVRVEVILDQNIPFEENGGASTGLSEGKNAAAVRFLRAQGIPVFFDNAAVYTHSKVVVIDEKTVILGSSNWTDTALNRNRESNVLLRSQTLARELLDEFHKIPRIEPAPEDDEVFVPDEFIRNENYFGRLARGDARALDLYLWLVREESRFTDPGAFTPRVEDMAETLGLLSRGRAKYRVQIRKTLAKLQTRYNLIEVDFSYSEDPRVTLSPLLGQRAIPIPSAYWSQRWDRTLSLPAKSFFLISQYESRGSPLRPRWSAAGKTLSRRYHLPLWTLSQGVTELRRRNLIEVDYSPNLPQKGYRRASIYTPNVLYDPRALAADIDRLKQKHGSEKFARAREAARAVYEEDDPNAAMALIDLENRYGEARVSDAVKIVARKRPDNPHRSIAYLIGVIKNGNGQR
jgi:hypothetical protein